MLGLAMHGALLVAALVAAAAGAEEDIGGCTASRQRVAIVTENTRASNKYGELASVINLLYTHRHGYDLHVERCPLGPLAPLTTHSENVRANYGKPSLVLKHLRNYDVVMFMDSDAYVHDHATTLEAFLDRRLAPQKSVLFARDCLFHYACWQKSLNAGVFIVRNTPDGVRVMEQWENATREGGACYPPEDVLFLDQGCITKLMDTLPGVRAAMAVLGEENSEEVDDSDFILNSQARPEVSSTIFIGATEHAAAAAVQVGSYVTHYVSCYGPCRRDRLLFAAQKPLREYLGIEMMRAWDDGVRGAAREEAEKAAAHGCDTHLRYALLEVSNHVRELERSPLFNESRPDPADDGEYGPPGTVAGKDVIIGARTAVEKLAAWLGCPGSF